MTADRVMKSRIALMILLVLAYAGSFALLGDSLSGLGLATPVALLALAFSRAWPGADAGQNGTSGGPSQFRWAGFLRPNALKVVVTLLLPALVDLLVTRSLESVLDFYGYLMTPTMPYYDGTTVTRVFNQYVLLWIPFYLAACTIAHIASVARGPARGEPEPGDEGETEGSQR